MAAVTDLIAAARAEWAAELDFAPSSSRPVLTWSWDGHAHTMLPDQLEASAIGSTISARMVRLLSRNYGADMGMHRALGQLEGWCRRRHVEQHEPLHEARGYLCPRLVGYVVLTANGAGEHGLDDAWAPGLRDNWYRRLVRRAALDEDLDYDEAADFIAAGLRQCNEWIDAWRAGAA